MRGAEVEPDGLNDVSATEEQGTRSGKTRQPVEEYEKEMAKMMLMEGVRELVDGAEVMSFKRWDFPMR